MILDTQIKASLMLREAIDDLSTLAAVAEERGFSRARPARCLAVGAQPHDQGARARDGAG